MWIEISLSGTLEHLSILQEEKRKLLALKEVVEVLYNMEDVDRLKLQEVLYQIDRLLRSVDRKYFFLEDLVTEFRKRKEETASELDGLAGMFSNYLDIEYSELD